MADRFTTAMTRLHARLSSRGGVAVVYARGATVVTLTAVVASADTLLSDPVRPSLGVAEKDRDYVIAVADLMTAGVFPPAPGDTIMAGGVVYGVQPRSAVGDKKVWEYGEADRVTVRVRTTQRG